MKGNHSVQFENMNLLLEIANLKTKINDLYCQTGPNSPDYIKLAIKLDLLINKYLEEKIANLVKI
ncbi:aspartyl-phosphate phosphatase Spo0E family protein [Neobacillus jeddahensis]|uniref:aspartyl-phosphate phosphatase Spo0E family protein n=1 Tax=Neobacillus jeddahensis TaxID=1461580 RepID=UPI00058E93B6|nr:Spo0E family sporulation regulatory protein-aspartic acid phosphatase [Neobacillus jeddahensis]